MNPPVAFFLVIVVCGALVWLFPEANVVEHLGDAINWTAGTMQEIAYALHD